MPAYRCHGLKLEVVLKWRDIYIGKLRMVSLIAGRKMEGTARWRGLKWQGPLYCPVAVPTPTAGNPVLLQ